MGIGLVLMHQELEQMKKVPGLTNALYNNVGSKNYFYYRYFRWHHFLLKNIHREYCDDLTNVPSRHCYCKLLVNGTTSETFNIYSIDSRLPPNKQLELCRR